MRSMGPVTSPSPAEILDLWFPDDRERANKMWWGKDPAFDAELRERFGPLLARAKAGELEDWAERASGRLALIILIDQFSRNIFRGDPETYAADAQARALTLEGLERGHDRELPLIQRLFFYMPLEHSEELEHQERCVALCEALAAEAKADSSLSEDEVKTFVGFIDFAVRHRDIVARFGRFPHRNELLGRASTPEEVEFLTQPGSSF